MTSLSHRCAPVDVLVCSIGRSQNTRERLKVLKSLWSVGFKAETIYELNPTAAIQEIQVEIFHGLFNPKLNNFSFEAVVVFEYCSGCLVSKYQIISLNNLGSSLLRSN